MSAANSINAIINPFVTALNLADTEVNQENIDISLTVIHN